MRHGCLILRSFIPITSAKLIPQSSLICSKTTRKSRCGFGICSSPETVGIWSAIRLYQSEIQHPMRAGIFPFVREDYCSAHIDLCCFQISCLVCRLETNLSLIYNLIQAVKFIQKQRPFLRSFLSLNIFIPSMLLLEHSENPDSSGPIT